MRILAVDDEYVALKKMKTLFSEYGDCDTAINGKQALRMFSEAYWDENLYDLISIDIEMPDMNGLELLERIVEQERLLMIQKARKIMVTAESTIYNLAQAVKNNCDDFLVKPVKKELLEQKLNELGIYKK